MVCDPEEVPLTKTKLQGNVYRDEVLELYYSLLAEQMPPAKVSHIIKSVLECFVPSLDVECLQLPKERCAGYMRREELRTISTAHKAYVLHESKSLNMNSDGTTKSFKKINGVAVNGTVLCLNEVSDGSAQCIAKDISAESAKLREIAKSLGLKYPERINWTLLTSSTSNSASTQKKFNRLVQQYSKEDVSVPLGPAKQTKQGISSLKPVVFLAWPVSTKIKIILSSLHAASFLTKLLRRFEANQTPRKELSHDEQMIRFKRRLSFVQYMPKKANKVGNKGFCPR